MDFLQEAGVNFLPWPARSPDLNTIQHVWDMMGGDCPVCTLLHSLFTKLKLLRMRCHTQTYINHHNLSMLRCVQSVFSYRQPKTFLFFFSLLTCEKMSCTCYRFILKPHCQRVMAKKLLLLGVTLLISLSIYISLHRFTG